MGCNLDPSANIRDEIWLCTGKLRESVISGYFWDQNVFFWFFINFWITEIKPDFATEDNHQSWLWMWWFGSVRWGIEVSGKETKCPGRKRSVCIENEMSGKETKCPARKWNVRIENEMSGFILFYRWHRIEVSSKETKCPARKQRVWQGNEVSILKRKCLYWKQNTRKKFLWPMAPDCYPNPNPNQDGHIS